MTTVLASGHLYSLDHRSSIEEISPSQALCFRVQLTLFAKPVVWKDVFSAKLQNPG